ncbi:MAG: hypothetical protein IBJ03_18380 [Gemmatimonadaceae bacterium]|nr:hypothetical protein [Gemmatimonadaceae bacterium]
MADGMMGDIGKVVGEVNGIVVPGLGEAIGPALRAVQEASKELGEGMQGPMHTLIEGVLDIETHVEMIDETTEMPDGTIVAMADHPTHDDSSSDAASDDTHTATEA